MILPAKRTRQTGFLFPNLYFSSRDGFNFETPFFINLSPSADLTLFPRYFTDRGLMAGAEFRYALEEDSKGMFLAHYLDDDLSDPEAEPDYYSDGKFTHSNQERYWVRGKADQNVGEWITRLDVDGGDGSGFVRIDVGVHLHGLEGHELLALRNGLADRAIDGDNTSRERAPDGVSRSGGRG